jgi:1-hydroxycarotenoid 3,4-desaturase
VATSDRIVIIGAGIGGLAAAIDCAARGFEVVVLERAAAAGGKLREVRAGTAAIDSGPTVLTMRWVFDELFEAAGARLDDRLTLAPCAVLARHAWSERERLDLFADVERSADAIGAFAGAGEARRYRAFCAETRRMYETLERPFLRADRPTPLSLVRRVGLAHAGALLGIRPFTTLRRALEGAFGDTRLRQLFGRYATYVGSSPFLAPATLMLIAHVEQAGVWMVAGGMQRLADALVDLATARGIRFRLGTAVRAISIEHGRVVGVELADGERIEAGAVVCNADAAALANGRLGAAAAAALPAPRARERSLSAITWSAVARARDFPLLRHNVFFARDAAAEFDALFAGGRVPDDPTVYVCAQDRMDREGASERGAERLLVLINAPADGDRHVYGAAEVEACEKRAFEVLARAGLRLACDRAALVATTPSDFERLFPATGGALYGTATHGWRASFRRPGARTACPNLYLAGGSAHPGAGIPMAALSGRRAAAAIAADFASTSRSRRAATSGGTSTAGATTDATASR